MFLFKNTKSKVKRIGMNMAVYGFAGVFVFEMFVFFLPKIIANYVYNLMLISSFVTIIGSIISIVCFIIELILMTKNKRLKKQLCVRCGEPYLITDASNTEPYCSSCFHYAEQRKTYICARCKKEISDEETEWIGNHRFCVECSASSRQATIKKHSEEKSRSVVYQKHEMIEIIESMKCFLKSQNYDIDIEENELTIVEFSNDPWNGYNKLIAKQDGIYNYVEVQMGGYSEMKRVSCNDFETACFLLLAMYVSIEKENPPDDLLITEIKKHIELAVNNSSDCWRGQFIIDKLFSLTK